MIVTTKKGRATVRFRKNTVRSVITR